MPFHFTQTWTDGRSEFDLTDVQPDVPVDTSHFGNPRPPPTLIRSPRFVT